MYNSHNATVATPNYLVEIDTSNQHGHRPYIALRLASFSAFVTEQKQSCRWVLRNFFKKILN